MSNIENSTNTIHDTKTQRENVGVETNGQLRIVFDEDIDDKNEVVEEVVEEVEETPSEEEKQEEAKTTKARDEEDKDPNQDELYKFDPERENYRDR
jgi:hypothetical protein